MGKQNIFSEFFYSKVESIDASIQTDNGGVFTFFFFSLINQSYSDILDVNSGINQCISNGSFKKEIKWIKVQTKWKGEQR